MTNSWTAAKLGELVSFKTGKLDSNAASPNGAYPFFTCSQQTLRTNTYAFDTECVLLAGNNADGIYPLKYFKGKFDAYQRTYVIRTLDDEILSNRFLYYALRPKLDLLRSISTGAATKFLTLTLLRDLEIDLPDPAIQARIVGVLSVYDDLIENNSRRIKILEETAQMLYREWFVHFRFPGHERVRFIDSSLGKIPRGWYILRVADFGQVITGKTPSKAVAEYFGQGMPFIKIPDMHGEMFCLQTTQQLTEAGAESQTKKTLPEDSICVSCIGTAGLVTMTTRPSQTNQQINSVVPEYADDREFLYYALTGLSDKIRSYGATGATMANLSKGKFEALEVITPPKSLRDDFHRIAAPVFDLIKVLGRQNINLRSTRDLLLPKFVSGEVDVESLG